MGAAGVVGLVVGILAINALLWVFLLRWVKRLTVQGQQDLGDRLARSGEPVVIPPCPGVYRGGTGRFGKVKGNAVVALTEQRLVFRKLLGDAGEIPLGEVVAVRADKWFRRAWSGGRLHLILRLRDGTEVGFFVPDHAAWKAAVERRITVQPPTQSQT
jgi:hypothetical protein